jgi:type VI secretion system protein ImpG
MRADRGESVFERYYQTELSYLRDMGRAFAEKHPSIAGMLAERGGDPDVERLIEGFAFVAARLGQRIDDAVPELIEGLTELLLPHFLRPTPASTIVEFRAPPDTLRGPARIQAGTRLASRQVRGKACGFRTSWAMDVQPIRLATVRLDDSLVSRPELLLGFSVDAGLMSDVLARGSIRLFLHGELPTAMQLYLWLVRHVSAVTLRTSDGATVELGKEVVQPIGFDASEALFPWPTFSPQGTRLLLEYLTTPAKFLFLDLKGLERAAHLSGSAFEIAVRFASPPPLPARLADDAVRLHCVPAVNLFDTSAEPVRVTMESRPTLLRAAGLDPLHAEVFSVRSVIGIGSTRSERRVYESFYSFRHALPTARHKGYYRIHREISPIDDGIHTFAQLERRDSPVLDDETLSIELLCTNRSLPDELRVGDISVATPDVPSGLSFANISLVTRPLRPPLGSDLSWNFIAHLAAPRRGFADRDVLVSMLSLYNLQERFDLPLGRVNRSRIEAIRSVTAKQITRVVRGAAVMGVLYRIEADLAGFACEGDAFLFGSVLHRFMQGQATLNEFADLQLVLHPANVSYRWHAEFER